MKPYMVEITGRACGISLPYEPENAREQKEDLAEMVADVIQQRDELLAVLQSMFNEHGEFDFTITILNNARAAIAKAEARNAQER